MQCIPHRGLLLTGGFVVTLGAGALVAIVATAGFLALALGAGFLVGFIVYMALGIVESVIDAIATQETGLAWPQSTTKALLDGQDLDAFYTVISAEYEVVK